MLVNLALVDLNFTLPVLAVGAALAVLIPDLRLARL